MFAAAGTEHEVVTPVEAERDRILAECERRRISAERVRFHIGPSQEVLPGLEPRPLDLALIDGAHGFPYPVLDWWFLAPRLRVQGLLMLDDCYMAPVGALADFLRSQESWEVTATPGRRTVVFRKLADARPGPDWSGERIGGRLSFRHLPPARRLQSSVAHRLLESRLGRTAATFARRLR